MKQIRNAINAINAKNGNLTLVFEVTVHGKGKTVSGSQVSDDNKITLHQRHEKLSNDLCQLLADKEFSDIQMEKAFEQKDRHLEFTEYIQSLLKSLA